MLRDGQATKQLRDSGIKRSHDEVKQDVTCVGKNIGQCVLARPMDDIYEDLRMPRGDNIRGMGQETIAGID